MNTETSTFISKITKDLPEIGWDYKKSSYFLFGELFVTAFDIGYEDHHMNLSGGKVMYDAFISVLEKYGKNLNYFFNEEEICYNNIDADIDVTQLTGQKYDIFVECIKKWIKSFKKIKETDESGDQVVLIHPDCGDWEIPSILKDFSTIIKSKDPCEFSVGILDKSKWNFSNKILREELQENSRDCFSIWVSNVQELRERLDDDVLTELFTVRPDALNLPIYGTDWD